MAKEIAVVGILAICIIWILLIQNLKLRVEAKEQRLIQESLPKLLRSELSGRHTIVYKDGSVITRGSLLNLALSNFQAEDADVRVIACTFLLKLNYKPFVGLVAESGWADMKSVAQEKLHNFDDWSKLIVIGEDTSFEFK